MNSTFSMMMVFVATTLVLLTFTGNVQAQTTCTWGAWAEWSTCSDTCGNCGSQQRTRSCSSTTSTATSCICSGDASQSQTCGPAICLYPRSSCCTGSPASVNGLFECA